MASVRLGPPRERDHLARISVSAAMSLLKSAAGLDEHGGVIERTRRAEAERVILGKSQYRLPPARLLGRDGLFVITDTAPQIADLS